MRHLSIDCCRTESKRRRAMRRRIISERHWFGEIRRSFKKRLQRPTRTRIQN